MIDESDAGRLYMYIIISLKHIFSIKVPIHSSWAPIDRTGAVKCKQTQDARQFTMVIGCADIVLTYNTKAKTVNSEINHHKPIQRINKVSTNLGSC